MINVRFVVDIRKLVKTNRSKEDYLNFVIIYKNSGNTTNYYAVVSYVVTKQVTML
ncbi:hypothetical protein [uncultured Aquimarina sp.]|uniref:hypothetical protein n=1 Tax=uncultured Aquimarina sp. TaxID=575652 RepID=UPI002606C2B0|nr:hypothetical protein [uncultured Aquimarina sp.]